MSAKIIKEHPSLGDVLDVMSDFIGFLDFPKKKDGTYPVVPKVVASVKMATIPVPNSRQTNDRCVIYFEKTKKGLIVNGKKLKMVLARWGDPSNWVGKTLVMTANPDAKMSGKVVGGVSISFKQGE